MNRILIIGAGSFIGTNFLKYSVNTNSLEVSLIGINPEEIDFKDVDIVLHLAAIVHQSKKIPENEYFRVNRDLCLSVAGNAKKAGIRQFIFLSTIKVYGKRDGSVIRNENSPCYPDDPYGRSKYEAEKALMNLADDKFAVSIIRTPLVYGEGVKANMVSLIRLIDRFPILPFYGAVNRRNFTFAGNLVAFIDRIIEKKITGVFIAMDNESLSITELTGFISKNLNKKVILFKFPGFIFRILMTLSPSVFERLFGALEFDNGQTRKILDFNPPYSTDEGIKRTVSHYLKQK